MESVYFVALFSDYGQARVGTRSNVFSYIKEFLGAPSPVDFDALHAENERLRRELDETRLRADDLAKKVSFLLLFEIKPSF